MKNKTSLITVAVVALTCLAHAGAPPASLEMIPSQINYQGRLLTPNNTPYDDGTHTIDLTLYDTASGGTSLWSERYVVQTRDGFFSVNLGAGGIRLLVPANLNREIWQVLWNDTANANSPTTFFMALTVRTGPNGAELPTPVESYPRQQFLTTPFAFRAHQSVYASKADGTFLAANLTTTNLSAFTLNATNITAPTLTAGAITTANLNANINPATSTVGGRAMFVRRTVNTNFTNTAFKEILHGFNTTDYDVVIAGWSTIHNPSTVVLDSLYIDPAQPDRAQAWFSNTVTSGGITVFFLGIRKGLSQFFNP